MFVRLNAMAMVSMSAVSGTMDEEARGHAAAAITRDSADLITANTDAAGFSYEMGPMLSWREGDNDPGAL